MNRNIMRAAGFGEQIRMVDQGKCPLCGKVVIMDDFKDELSRREFKISGICQKCQDDIF